MSLLKMHPNTAKRQKQEKEGGWLPIYIEVEPCVITRATTRCFYCGFGIGDGHDFACRYVAFNGPVAKDTNGQGTHVLVPKGGLPPSRSFF